LDESFSALDTKSMVAACDVVSEYGDLTGSGLVLASHHDFPQRFLCDQAYIVENLSGRLEPDLFSALDQEQALVLNQAQVTTVSVQVQSENHGFLETKIGQQSIFVTCPKRWEPGHARVSIPANEVSIAIGDDHQTSMVNRLNGRIRSMTLKDNESVWVELEIEQQRLRVSISNWSHERLELKVDQSVFAEFKVGAVQWHGQSHHAK
jgi:molybdopterin-binding protein